jgi:hypothetical protein
MLVNQLLRKKFKFMLKYKVEAAANLEVIKDHHQKQEHQYRAQQLQDLLQSQKLDHKHNLQLQMQMLQLQPQLQMQELQHQPQLQMQELQHQPRLQMQELQHQPQLQMQELQHQPQLQVQDLQIHLHHLTGLNGLD